MAIPKNKPTYGDNLGPDIDGEDLGSYRVDVVEEVVVGGFIVSRDGSGSPMRAAFEIIADRLERQSKPIPKYDVTPLMPMRFSFPLAGETFTVVVDTRDD